jgi:hypothetical protein
MQHEIMTEKVEQCVRDTDPICGSDSFFYRLDDEWGIKFFMSPLMRDRNYERHLKYSEVAPEVGPKVEADLDHGYMYGFLVEICETEHDLCCDDMSEIGDYLWGWFSAHNYSPRDLHEGNVGRTMDGRDVVIDFSRFSDSDGFTYHNLSGRVEACINGQWHRARLNEDETEWEIA